MAVAFGDVDYVLELDVPDEQVRNLQLHPHRLKSASNITWIPTITSEDCVSIEFLKNKFFVDVTIRNLGGPSINLCVNGATRMEHVCSSCFTKLRETGRLGYDELCCMFRTFEEPSLLIPSGTFMGELYEKSPSPDGTGVLLSATLVSPLYEGCFVISPGDDFLMGNWMMGLMSQ